MTAHPCPICAGDRTTVFLRRDGVPVHQNLVMATPEAARSLARGDLTFAVCPDCGFVFNQAFDLARLAYGEDYDNTQSCSATFNTYLDGLVEDLVDRHGVRNCAIVEVGCGKGGFLRKLVEFADANNTGTGFDPSYVGEATSSDGRLTFRQCYYDDACTEIPAGVVVCRHVIEHVPDPMSLLRSVRAALSRSPRARVFFETPCVDWILRNQVVWDFFYEHCSLFTASSLGVAFERAGFAVDRVKHIFGGSTSGWRREWPGPPGRPSNPARPCSLPRPMGPGRASCGSAGRRGCSSWEPWAPWRCGARAPREPPSRTSRIRTARTSTAWWT